jgi:hypothetical protein
MQQTSQKRRPKKKTRNGSPYTGIPNQKWLKTTYQLVSQHPILGSKNLLHAIDSSWAAVWNTSIGQEDLVIRFRDLSPRAQIVGDFFENVLALQLSRSGAWRRGSSKEKDLVFLGTCRTSGEFDFEIKTSGQATGKIYGNRSYAQPGENGAIDSDARKKRSGYYLCVNFWKDAIYRIRVGWIDPGDWEPQKSPTGQMAGLKEHVYRYKLINVPGPYYLEAPVFVLNGIGGKSINELLLHKIARIGDLIGLLDVTGTLPSADVIAETFKKAGVSAKVAATVGRCCSDPYFKAAWEVATTIRKAKRK